MTAPRTACGSEGQGPAASDGEAELSCSGPVQRGDCSMRGEKILNEEKRGGREEEVVVVEGGGMWLGNSCDWVADSATRDTARK